MSKHREYIRPPLEARHRYINAVQRLTGFLQAWGEKHDRWNRSADLLHEAVDRMEHSDKVRDPMKRANLKLSPEKLEDRESVQQSKGPPPTNT